MMQANNCAENQSYAHGVNHCLSGLPHPIKFVNRGCQQEHRKFFPLQNNALQKQPVIQADAAKCLLYRGFTPIPSQLPTMLSTDFVDISERRLKHWLAMLPYW